jgi:hypothetical protein
MNVTKQKAKRITDRPTKKEITDRNIYAGSEEVLLNKGVLFYYLLEVNCYRG